MTIDQVLGDHPSHYEMVGQIRRTLANACPATFIGFNSLRYDEELLRQAFYQCLHPPYLTNTGGSTRADALHLVRATAFLHPESINIPTNEKGKPSFRLELLAPANGFNFRAHDALSDSEAVVFLCRLIKDRCPALWARFLRFSRKSTVVDFLSQEDAFVVVEYSGNRVTPFVVTAVGDPGKSTGAYCYDLTVDPVDLRGLSDADLAKRSVRRPNPLRKVKTNAAPTLCPLSDAPQSLLGENAPEEFARRGRLVREDKAFCQRLVAVAESTETKFEPSPYVERQLYDGGFWSNEDQRKLDKFHAVSWAERVEIANQLEDKRLAWLARRLIFVERPDLLAEDHRTMMATELAQRMIADADDCGGWTTLDRAMTDLMAMLVDMDEGSAEPLRKLGTFLEGKRQRAMQFHRENSGRRHAEA
jgi:exodeoxyribonuclease-1